jgi:uncharacterized membrane protein YgdD (TMEM256/DUF423 family)
MKSLFISLGAANAALGVILGAYGAHGLRNHLSTQMLDVYRTGVEYHMYHAFGLILIGLAAGQMGGRLLGAAGWFMFAGIVLFSGSLYALSLSGIRWLGIITPFGGLSFIIAWALFAYAARQSR